MRKASARGPVKFSINLNLSWCRFETL